MQTNDVLRQTMSVNRRCIRVGYKPGYSAVQILKAASAYTTSKQILPSGIAEQY